MTDPIISIAMATYNGARYIQEQLDSFTSQAQLPDELIVSDDGSTDDTVQIIKKFSTTAPFAVVLHENGSRVGVLKNFETALSLCSGDIIFISDQDDVWFPNKIAAVVRSFDEKRNTYLFVNDQIITDGELVPSKFTKLRNVERLGFSEKDLIPGCCTAIRRELLAVILPIPSSAHAYDVWIHRIAHQLGVRQVLRTPLQYYRRHGNNVSDWVASQPRYLSQIDIVKKYGLASVVSEWNKGIADIRISVERIDSALPYLESVGLGEQAREALIKCEVNISRLQGRIEMMSVPRLARSKDVLSFWMDGHYEQFSGWKSAVKDLIRRA